jgi:hypothetical protein
LINEAEEAVSEKAVSEKAPSTKAKKVTKPAWATTEKQ